ncbi:unnamed protein product [Closterium sp. Naga37s-1]|nr:unnamed protein product [Closterium sp. Naga37s-1]
MEDLALRAGPQPVDRVDPGRNVVRRARSTRPQKPRPRGPVDNPCGPGAALPCLGAASAGPVAYPCGPGAALPGPGAALPGPGAASTGPDAAPPGPDAAPPGPDAAPPSPAAAPPGPAAVPTRPRRHHRAAGAAELLPSRPIHQSRPSRRAT